MLTRIDDDRFLGMDIDGLGFDPFISLGIQPEFFKPAGWDICSIDVYLDKSRFRVSKYNGVVTEWLT